MSAKIKFVRMYKAYRENWYDIVYESGRCRTCTEPELPATAERFVEASTDRREQYDSVFKRTEMIYS